MLLFAQRPDFGGTLVCAVSSAVTDAVVPRDILKARGTEAAWWRRREMATERTLAFLTVAVLLQKWTCEFEGARASPVTYAYKALEGEFFLVQCAPPRRPLLYNMSDGAAESTAWFRQDGEAKAHVPGTDESVVKVGNSLWFSKIAERHSGNYSCHNGEGTLHFLVSVVRRTGCEDHGRNHVKLTLKIGGRITCPGVRCYTSAPEPAITWYKNNRTLDPERGDPEGDGIYLRRVLAEDSANFTCDLSHEDEDGIAWTVRRTVRVRAMQNAAVHKPLILHPHGNKTEEVELGRPHTLACRVQFESDGDSRSPILWWANYHDNGSQLLKMDDPVEEKSSVWEYTLNRSAHLPEVTERHLRATFTCWAQNSGGNSSATITLRRKPAAAGLILVIALPVVALFFVTGVSVLVRIHWFEIYLLYRTYLPLEDSVSAGKEYDAFVSCVSGPSSAGGEEEEEDGDLTGETLGLCHLPDVLEKQAGYRLCLLQRDSEAGGAYTEDVLRSIQRSRRVICVLSPRYLRSACLYELETGLQALREDPELRLILVWSGQAPPLLGAPPLPPAVRRALRVLPALRWSPGDSAFWEDLKRAMPARTLAALSVGAKLCAEGGAERGEL
ncbi:hypothetical protein AAFF_G00166690 [Aldrovandia affinis]|uniref:Interleukin-18 receptor 1 n=1 Tax=Aldrovandia affinis TaxID=143900 RepID=A0AAD7RMD9_9TELE|nr:hypothetical protein AAFF_G00166690 [Aldrovandia affinis]